MMDKNAALLLFNKLEEGNIFLFRSYPIHLSCGEESDGSSVPERDRSDTDDEMGNGKVFTDGDTDGVCDDDDDGDDVGNGPQAGNC